MSIGEKLAQVRQEIRTAALAAGRNPEEITLIAVSKTRPLSAVEEAMLCQQLDYGENRPQELAQKQEAYPQLRWHQIGQLQRNKVKLVVGKAVLIHSVDTLSLAEAIEKRAATLDIVQDILIQVNISGEASKSGVAPSEAIALCEAVAKLPHVRIQGLMTISVKDADDEENQRIFGGLQRLAEEIDGKKFPNVSMKERSMGMTHDYKAAIAAGATMVRVGTGIFGPRDYATIQ